MSDRRKLIVASNRGAGLVPRTRTAGASPRRGGGGLVTALRSLVSQHDVTWIASAMTEEDRAVAAEAGGERSRRRRATARRTGCASSSATPPRTTGTTTSVSNPTLWFIQHYLWDLAYEPAFDQGLHHAWEEGYVRVNQAFAEAILSRARARARGDRLPARLPPVPRARTSSGRRRRTRCSRTSSTSPGPSRTCGACCPSRFAGPCTRACSGTTSSRFHARRWARNFVRSCADFVGVEVDRGRGLARLRRPAHPRARAIRSRSTPPSSTSSRCRRRCAPRRRSCVARRPEKLILRVDRTDLVEEHGARLPRVRGLPGRRIPRCTAA